jgi:zinc transporter ZupT
MCHWSCIVAGVRSAFVAAIGIQIGVFLGLSSSTVYAAAGGAEPLVQPLAGWLIGVLVVLVISILSRHRPSKFGREQAKSPLRGEQ